MINILIIAPSLSPGGMERQLSYFLLNYDRSKLNVTLALLRNKISYNIPADIEIIHLKYRHRSIQFYYTLIKQLSNKKYDLINSKISGLNELVMLFCGILNKKNVITEIRNSGENLIPYYRKSSFLLRVFKKQWQIVCNNNKALIEIKSFLPENAKVIYINNGIDIKKFKKRNNNHDCNIIGFVGTLRPEKNLEVIIKAIKLLNGEIDIKLQIIGRENYDIVYTNKIKQLVNNLGVDECVEFLGNKSDVEMYYSAFDIFVLPSIHEGTPNALLEAMSSQCLCLVSKSANSDNFLDTQFEFSEHDARDLAEKIKYVYNLSFDFKERVGIENRKYVEKHFSLDRMVTKYTSLFETYTNKNEATI